MRTTLVLLPLLSGSLLLAQATGPASPVATARACGVLDSYGIAEADGPPLAIGPDYRARFEPGRVTFTPALGSRAPRTLPLAWSFVAVERDGGALAADPRAEPQVDGDAVTYAHGAGLLERYDARRDGIEQSFVLSVLPPGTGDLVVRLELASELPGQPVDRGARFSVPGVGGVSFGAVTGVDAGGATAPGTVVLAEGSLALVLPAEFVDRARLPLVVDPLVGTWFPVVGSDNTDDGHPDVAYDRDTDTFLAVWQRSIALGDIDVRGRRFDAAGNLLGQVLQFEIDDTLVGFDPKIANVNVRDRYVVVWEQAPGLFAPAELVGRSVTAAPIGAGTLGPVKTIAAPAVGVLGADVGGERRNVHDDVLVVWGQSGYGVRAREVQVADDGTLTTFPIQDVAVSSGGDSWGAPVLSKTAGDSARFLVVFRNSATPGHLSARALKPSGAPLGVQRDDVADPSSALTISEYDVDGDGDLFAVVYRQQESAVSPTGAIFGRPVRCQDGDLVLGEHVTVHDDPGVWETEPAVAYTGDHFVVAWIDEAGDFPVEPDSPHAIAVDAFTLEPCGPENAVVLSKGVDVALAIVGRYAGGDDPAEGALPDAMLVWQSYDDVTSQSDILAMSFETLTDVDELAPGCGAGTAYASGAYLGNPDFTLRLLGAPPTTIAFLAIAFGTNPIACGPCTIVPDFSLPSTKLFAATTDPLGAAAYTVPLPAGIPELTAYAQWATLGGAACELVLDLELSSGISFDLVLP
jgi:hypothetical protein